MNAQRNWNLSCSTCIDPTVAHLETVRKLAAQTNRIKEQSTYASNYLLLFKIERASSSIYRILQKPKIPSSEIRNQDLVDGMNNAVRCPVICADDSGNAPLKSVIVTSTISSSFSFRVVLSISIVSSLFKVSGVWLFLRSAALMAAPSMT